MAFPTVQDAVDVSNGSDDVIIVTEDLRGSIQVTNRELTIQGIGMQNVVLTADAPQGQVLLVDGNSSVVVRHLTIDGEHARRGALLNDSASLTMEGVKLARGQTPPGGSEDGGGVASFDTSSLTLTGCIVCDGVADDDGGGVKADNSTSLAMMETVLFGNDGNDRGGAVRVEAGTNSVTNCTFYDNSAERGAAVYAFDTDLDLLSSVVVANDAWCSLCTGYAIAFGGTGSLGGGGNLYEDNEGGDTQTLQISDFLGSSGLVPPPASCLEATLADFTAETMGMAAVNAVGAVGIDTDADGYGVGPDCQESDSTIHPGAVEEAGDGVDQNCDGVELCFVDGDGDGVGDETTWSTDVLCDVLGLSMEGGDCDDADADRFPGATDIPADGIDSDCDGVEICFVDLDMDGYADLGSNLESMTGCQSPGESVTTANDCDDDQETVNPGVLEIAGDGVDQNCDGEEIQRWGHRRTLVERGLVRGCGRRWVWRPREHSGERLHCSFGHDRQRPGLRRRTTVDKSVVSGDSLRRDRQRLRPIDAR